MPFIIKLILFRAAVVLGNRKSMMGYSAKKMKMFQSKGLRLSVNVCLTSRL